MISMMTAKSYPLPAAKTGIFDSDRLISIAGALPNTQENEAVRPFIRSFAYL
jgi:hypothetical protein